MDQLGNPGAAAQPSTAVCVQPDGNRSYAAFLPGHVHHVPAANALLDVLERQPDGFVAPQPAAGPTWRGPFYPWIA